jgi:hypothetical protein
MLNKDCGWFFDSENGNRFQRFLDNLLRMFYSSYLF